MNLTPKFECQCRECGACFVRVRDRGDMTRCNRCRTRAQIQGWKTANPERAKAINTQPSKEAKERFRKSERGMELARAKASRHYHKDAEASRAKQRARYAANRDAHIQRVVDRSKRVRKATPPWADRQAIAAIYRQARRLTRETGVLHHVDHDIPLHGERVHGLHVETNLVVLPAVINQAKSNRFQGAS